MLLLLTSLFSERWSLTKVSLLSPSSGDVLFRRFKCKSEILRIPECSESAPTKPDMPDSVLVKFIIEQITSVKEHFEPGGLDLLLLLSPFPPAESSSSLYPLPIKPSLKEVVWV